VSLLRRRRCSGRWSAERGIAERRIVESGIYGGIHGRSHHCPGEPTPLLSGQTIALWCGWQAAEEAIIFDPVVFVRIVMRLSLMLAIFPSLAGGPITITVLADLGATPLSLDQGTLPLAQALILDKRMKRLTATALRPTVYYLAMRVLRGLCGILLRELHTRAIMAK
jgi:hypothetical protein